VKRVGREGLFLSPTVKRVGEGGPEAQLSTNSETGKGEKRLRRSYRPTVKRGWGQLRSWPLSAQQASLSFSHPGIHHSLTPGYTPLPTLRHTHHAALPHPEVHPPCLPVHPERYTSLYMPPCIPPYMPPCVHPVVHPMVYTLCTPCGTPYGIHPGICLVVLPKAPLFPFHCWSMLPAC